MLQAICIIAHRPEKKTKQKKNVAFLTPLYSYFITKGLCLLLWIITLRKESKYTALSYLEFSPLLALKSLNIKETLDKLKTNLYKVSPFIIAPLIATEPQTLSYGTGFPYQYILYKYCMRIWSTFSKWAINYCIDRAIFAAACNGIPLKIREKTALYQ